MGTKNVPADRRQRPRAGAPMLPARLAVLALGTPGPRRGLIKKEKRLELNSVIVRISKVCFLRTRGCGPVFASTAHANQRWLRFLAGIGSWFLVAESVSRSVL